MIEARTSFALVEDQDRDRTLSMLFAPPEKRGALSALYAFDIETSRVRDMVSQPLPGEIRLQWWRDLIASGAKTGSGHPIADELLEVIDRYELPRSAFERFLEARIFDLYDDPFPTTEDFETYAGETRSTLIMLAAMVLSKGSAERIGDVAGHAGVALCAASVLRLLPQSRSRGQVRIPVDILTAAGCTTDEFLSGKPEARRQAITAFCAYGRDHDTRWRGLLKTVPKPVRVALLPAALTGLTFDAAEKSPDRMNSGAAENSPLTKSWRYWRTMRG
ncbi:phytoene/squalene synthase family protein [Fulvimarina sp. MAC8]|uniref:phytoene/squalene synthase family protein n=1 Tax=Fulvimarina sp. MAC8 TaxID=3162874 RepID=UPI0032EB939A